MNDRNLVRQALDKSLGVKRGERVWINGWDHTVDLMSSIALGCEERGCEVLTTVQSEDPWLRSLSLGQTRSLERLSSQQAALLGSTDHYIFTLGPKHPIDWARIPPTRRQLATVWLLEQNKFVAEWKSTAKTNRVKMLGIEATLATRERAEALGLDYDNWTRVMHSGCQADSQLLARTARKVARYLRGRANVRIATPTGTDLSFGLDDREIEVSDGIVSERKARAGTVVFLPAGAIGVTVDEKGAKGRVVYDNTIRFSKGKIVKLEFAVESGRIVNHRARSGVAVFESYLRESPGDADRFAFFGIGLNPNLRLGYTQDDKVLGAVELNFGENRSRGGKNQGRGNWWGTVNRATITVDGHKIMENGKLLV